LLRPRAASACRHQRINSFGIGEIEIHPVSTPEAAHRFTPGAFRPGRSGPGGRGRIVSRCGVLQSEFDRAGDTVAWPAAQGLVPVAVRLNGNEMAPSSPTSSGAPARPASTPRPRPRCLTGDWVKVRGDGCCRRQRVQSALTAELWETHSSTGQPAGGGSRGRRSSSTSATPCPRPGSGDRHRSRARAAGRTRRPRHDVSDVVRARDDRHPISARTYRG
jgi:hypothetical protein